MSTFTHLFVTCLFGTCFFVFFIKAAFVALKFLALFSKFVHLFARSLAANIKGLIPTRNLKSWQRENFSKHQMLVFALSAENLLASLISLIPLGWALFLLR